MSEIRNVKLELLRSGPANNQLLSPLTPYMALCGADGPVTVTIPFEHGQLLTRLDRLLSEMSSARDEQRELVHLRLSMGAYELALVPFELAIAQDGYPGSGSPLLLQ